MAIFVFGSAYAQEAEEIWAEFCEEIGNYAGKALSDLADANNDLNECLPDFRDCRTGEGFGRADSLADCLDEGYTCTSRANNKKEQACIQFKEDLEDSWQDTLRQAGREDVEEELKDYLNGSPDPRLGECFRPARQVLRACAGRRIARSGD